MSNVTESSSAISFVLKVILYAAKTNSMYCAKVSIICMKMHMFKGEVLSNVICY